MIKRLLNRDYKEIITDSPYILDCTADPIKDDHIELWEGRAITKRIVWADREAFKTYLQLRYGVIDGLDGTDLIVKIDKGERGRNYVDVTIRRLNESEALDASNWLESKLPKYNMLDIEPPFATV